jgi:hypothetical protein
MAIGKAVPLLVIAAAALAFAGKKRNGAEDLRWTGETGEGEPPPDDGLPPIEMKAGPTPVEMPEDAHEQFIGSYEAAVDDCFVELGLVDGLEIKICALDKIFPEAVWPPPQNAHQWQRNFWHHQDFNNYVVSKYPPIT